MANFDKGNFTKVWLTKLTKKVFKGENKGEEYDQFVGHLDIGNGKMIEISFYANQEPVMVDDKRRGEVEKFVISARKWKGNVNRSAKKSKKSW